MRILVIGGTKFIGPHVVRHLADAGHDVTVFHRGQSVCALPAGVAEFHGDRRELPALAGELRRLAPAVVLDMIPYTESDALDVMRVFRGVAERVVAVSSMDVYQAYGLFRRDVSGPPSPAPFDEDAPLRTKLFPYREAARAPDDMLYNYEKILVERAVLGDAELSGTVVRLAKVYGPGDEQHRLYEYLKRMDDGRPAVLLEEGKARWRWTRVYVEDAGAAVALAAADVRAAGRVYNVGEEEALTEAEWVEGIGEAAGWAGKVVAVPRVSLPGHLAEPYDWAHHLAADTTRIREELGYRERRGRRQALRESVEWERAHAPAGAGPSPLDYAAEDEALGALGS